MSQKEKGELWQQLKKAGVEFPLHYREYTEADLQAAWDKVVAERPAPPPDPIEEVSPAEAQAFFGQRSGPGPGAEAAANELTTSAGARLPNRHDVSGLEVRPADPDEMPGQRLNQNVELEPIRTDEQGRIWYQEEVRKPAFPKPRGRRVMDYVDTGTETRTEQVGEFVETFEVAGTRARRPAQVKITLPSYQVGIYKDRRFPFKIHVYNEKQGFDLFEVQDYYGGAELVPTHIKKTYVENDLCYDIRTVVRAIEAEYRQLQLQGRIPR